MTTIRSNVPSTIFGVAMSRRAVRAASLPAAARQRCSPPAESGPGPDVGEANHFVLTGEKTEIT